MTEKAEQEDKLLSFFVENAHVEKSEKLYYIEKIKHSQTKHASTSFKSGFSKYSLHCNLIVLW